MVAISDPARPAPLCGPCERGVHVFCDTSEYWVCGCTRCAEERTLLIAVDARHGGAA